MTAYFRDDLKASMPIVEQLADWINGGGIPTIFAAADVQHNPDAFKKGDIAYTRVADIKHMEVKAERYLSTNTPNLAIERYSDTARRTPGGPFATGAHTYAHYYMCGLLVLMDTLALIQWLTPALSQFRSVPVPNDGYVTTVHLVPRRAVKLALGNRYREIQAPAWNN